MKWVVAILMLSLIIDETLCQRQRGRAGGRRLRNRQRQGRLLASQNDFGVPPQPDILLPIADPVLLTVNRRQPQPLFNDAPVNQFRAGRQFNIDGDDGAIRGSFPDEVGNYNFQYSSDDGSTRQENGAEGNLKDGEFSWISPEGEVITFAYTADEDGYQAQGSHIPQEVPLPANLRIWQDLLLEGRR